MRSVRYQNNDEKILWIRYCYSYHLKLLLDVKHGYLTHEFLRNTDVKVAIAGECILGRSNGAVYALITKYRLLSYGTEILFE